MSSTLISSRQFVPLLTLGSELALLLVARGESEELIVLLFGGPDLTLYTEEAGVLVTRGRRFPGILLVISICLIAISRDVFESVLPKLSCDDSVFPNELLVT